MTIPTSSRANSNADRMEMNKCIDESDELREIRVSTGQQMEKIMNRMTDIHSLKARFMEAEGTPIDWENIYHLADEILKEVYMIKTFESIFILEKDHLNGQRIRAQSARSKMMDKMKVVQRQSVDWIEKKLEFFSRNSKAIDAVYESVIALQGKIGYANGEMRKLEDEIEFFREKEMRVLHELAKWKDKHAEVNQAFHKDNPNEGAMDALSKFLYIKSVIETELGEIYLKVKAHEDMVKDVTILEEKISQKLVQTDEKEADLRKIQQKCDELRNANAERIEKMESKRKLYDEHMRIFEDRLKNMANENKDRLEEKEKLLEAKEAAIAKAAELVKRKEKAQKNITEIMKKKEMFEMLNNMNPDESDDEDLDKTLQQKKELLEKLRARSRSNSKEKVITKKTPRTY